MKIYTRVVIQDGKTIEEESFDYKGPIAECKGGGVTYKENPPTAQEIELQELMISQLKQEQFKYTTEDDIVAQQDKINSLSSGSPERAEAEKELNKMHSWLGESQMQDYSYQLMEQQIENLPMDQQQKEWAYEMAQEQYEYYKSPEYQAQKELSSQITQWQLESVETARELGGITGDLSEQEMGALDTMEQNAIETLTSNINREQEEVMGGVISSLVDRGVLQGDIGAKVMGDVYERSMELLSEGVAGTETQKMQNILQMGEAQKGRQLQQMQMMMGGQISQEQLKQGWTGQAMQMAGGQSALNQQFTQNATQLSAGLSQDWQQTQLNTGLQAWGNMGAQRGDASNRALQSAIAQSQASAAGSASQWGAMGSAAGMIGAAAIMSSRRYKKDIKYLGFDAVPGIEAVCFRYKPELNMPGLHIGCIAEEVAKVRPDAVVFDSEGRPDAINYTQLFKGV